VGVCVPGLGLDRLPVRFRRTLELSSLLGSHASSERRHGRRILSRRAEHGGGMDEQKQDDCGCHGCLSAALRPRSSAWPHAPAPAPSFLQGHDAIDAWRTERLARAVWPPNDDAIDLRRLAKAKMRA
jgi:hypothetical protein